MTIPLESTVLDTVNQLREPLGLDRWAFYVENGDAGDDARAACNAMPEYREATIVFNFDAMKTGDDLDEFVVHEMTHCHTWPLHAVAEQLANALADSLPQYARDALRKKLQEEVREAAERVTTDVGHAYLRLLRRAGVLPTPVVS